MEVVLTLWAIPDLKRIRNSNSPFSNNLNKYRNMIPVLWTRLAVMQLMKTSDLIEGKIM